MWNWLTPASLVTLQRRAALGRMAEEARILLRDGYPVEADAILDAINDRRSEWGMETGIEW